MATTAMAMWRRAPARYLAMLIPQSSCVTVEVFRNHENSAADFHCVNVEHFLLNFLRKPMLNLAGFHYFSDIYQYIMWKMARAPACWRGCDFLSFSTPM